ncbi:MAG: DNA adenine methylase [Bdellovibrionales bacterium]|jgi:adenine-specific DNA-methyltransferase
MKWAAAQHSANTTDEYLFHQLIPYIGNKRKLLGLIHEAITAAGATPDTHDFVDLFAGTGVVSRYARSLGFRAIANDWEPYAQELNRCAIETSAPPVFFGKRSYESVLEELNALPPREDWVTQHLCPRDDESFDSEKDRLFFMRKNGLRIDAIRHQIDVWEKKGDLDPRQRAALLAPLLYQCCYNSNTSGVFKGFHNGWGGQTKTALYRIMGDVALRPALFHDNGHQSLALRLDAQTLAETLDAYAPPNRAFVYLDPPYNQHPYGSNYHVLNSVALWDKPTLPPQITARGDKAAIRTDWRTERRSAYNHKREATAAYHTLLQTLQAPWIATSYSTDGMIPLREMIRANVERGDVQVFTRPYKRYRVSSQRASPRPMNIEYILLTQTGVKPRLSIDALVETILKLEKEMLETS